MTTRPVLVEAITAAVEAAAPAPPEQLELLPPTRFKPGEDRHADMLESVRRQRAGRPPGARNMATREATEFIRRMLGEPLVERARWLLHSPESLARELGCTKLEAYDRLVDGWDALARYMHAPLAAVDARGNAIPPALTVLIGGRELAISPAGEELPPWERDHQEIEQNQALVEGDPEKSHAAKSQEVG